jgi:hypothetical protein
MIKQLKPSAKMNHHLADNNAITTQGLDAQTCFFSESYG